MKKPLLFENNLCGRCAGSGSFSFNLMHGSMCYGCNGSGYKLTKRGAAAARFLRDSRHKPVEEFVVGELIYDTPGMFNRGGFLRISKIETRTGEECGVKSLNPETGEYEAPEGVQYVITAGTDNMKMYMWESTSKRQGFDAETKAKQIADALEYEKNLTKAGKPRKNFL